MEPRERQSLFLFFQIVTAKLAQQDEIENADLTSRPQFCDPFVARKILLRHWWLGIFC